MFNSNIMDKKDKHDDTCYKWLHKMFQEQIENINSWLWDVDKLSSTLIVQPPPRSPQSPRIPPRSPPPLSSQNPPVPSAVLDDIVKGFELRKLEEWVVCS